jgi:hypothetical protein
LRRIENAHPHAFALRCIEKISDVATDVHVFYRRVVRGFVTLYSTLACIPNRRFSDCVQRAIGK